MTLRILAAGDYFILPSIFIEHIGEELKAAGFDGEVEYRKYQSPWPGVPFGRVGEVEEGSGTEEELMEAFAGVNISTANHAALTRRIIESTPTLRMAVIARGGPTNVNMEAATEHGVVVCNAPGRNAAATAEHSLSLIFSVIRRITQLDAELHAGHWRGDFYEYEKAPLELDEATAGIIGYGHIGSIVARLLKACGCHVLVYDPYATPEQMSDEVERTELAELLKRSQIVTLHARLTDENQQMIGREQLAMMPKHSVLINCARGGLVDYEAVCDALDSGHLWGAGFDVFPQEKVSAGSRLLTTPNIVMTPHVAGASKQTAHKAARIAAQEIARYVTGKPLKHCRNPEVLRMAGRDR